MLLRRNYVEIYGNRALIAASTILILSILDGYFTIFLVKRGIQEANPIMEFYLQLKPPIFLIVKYVISYLSIILLIIHKDFYVLKTSISVKKIMLAIIGVYSVLIVWEMILIILSFYLLYKKSIKFL